MFMSVRQRAHGTFGQVYGRKNARSAKRSGMLQHGAGTHLDEARCKLSMQAVAASLQSIDFIMLESGQSDNFRIQINFMNSVHGLHDSSGPRP